MTRPKWMEGKTKQPCAVCGEPAWGRRHRACTPRATPRPERSHAERQRRAEVVRAWRQEHGDICPGWGRAAHVVIPPNRLTADHLVPYRATGQEDTELGVLCNACNGRKQDRITPSGPRARAQVEQPKHSPSRAWSIASSYLPSGTC